METNNIKKRKSYQMFERILKAFAISPKNGIKTVHLEIDKKQGYGSQTLSVYALESLNLLIKESSGENASNKEEEVLYTLKVTFQDVLDNAPNDVKEFYNKLTEQQQQKFIMDNAHGCKKGLEWGLSDPVHDCIQTLGQNLDIDN